MSARVDEFGTLADGRVVERVRLGGGEGLEVEVLTWGAAIRSLRVPTKRVPIETVLPLPDLAAYESDQAYHGVVVGRVANRISGAAFEIDDRRYEVPANEGPNCLHGGRFGLSRRLWRIEAAEADRATLAYVSPDGEEGFPGNLAVRVEFVLSGPREIEITWTARTDRATPVNLTHHLYFNLSGDPSRDVRDHVLTIAAQAFTPVGPGLIPTGELRSVEGTPFDLRGPRRIGEALAQSDPQLAAAGGYDHNWVLDAYAAPAVVLCSPETDLSLLAYTDQPGVQVYTGQGLGAPFEPFGAVVLEPQNFPDAVNQPGFPDPVLRPDKAYRRFVRYRFEGGR